MKEGSKGEDLRHFKNSIAYKRFQNKRSNIFVRGDFVVGGYHRRVTERTERFIKFSCELGGFHRFYVQVGVGLSGGSRK